MSKPMREVQIGEPGTTAAVIETLRHAVVMLQMPTVFVLLAPPNSEGVARLDRTKLRQPNKNYGTALGELGSFYAMATPGTLPPELDSVAGLQRLSGAFIRIAVAPSDYSSPMVRKGTAQGLLLEGPHRELFRAVEASLADVVEPAIVGGHRFAAPLCTSANISGHPDGSIVSWERAYAFGVERDIPLVVRCEPEPGLLGSYPIFWLQRDRVRIERDGPRREELAAALPARLFQDDPVESAYCPNRPTSSKPAPAF
jgi:tRNA A37 threonylcarbamoyladenosine synthetase subunit TsaC/SUA5/YrdC